MELTGEYNIELKITESGQMFLNYWDWAHGNDVNCEIRDGKLFIMDLVDDKIVSDREITIGEFVDSVKRSINKISELYHK